jgi:uncharacterized RDD family membrane protein YckC
MSIVQIATPFNLRLDFEVADFHKRIFAYCIDLLIIVAYSWIMGHFVYNDDVAGSLNEGGGIRLVFGWSILLISVPILLYPLVCEILMHGQTIGKKVFDIRVMNLNGGEPSLSQYIIRWIFRFFEWPLVFGFFIPIVLPGALILIQVLIVCFFGIIVIIIVAVTKNHQRLGDLAANTVLVKTRINTSINDTVFQEVDQKNYTVQFPQVMQLSDRDINTIKSVLSNSANKNGEDLAWRIADRVKAALKIEANMHPINFLDKLLEDYNYLATKE